MSIEQDDTGDDGEGAGSRVERRIATITKRRKEAEDALRAAQERIDALEDEVTTYKSQAKTFESVTAELESYRQKEAQWVDERAMISVGLTDAEGVDMARLAYNRIKAEERPKGGIAEWLSNRDALPKGVQAYLPQPTEAVGAAKPPPRATPNTDARAKHTPGSPPTYQAGQVSSMSDADLAASREAIWASMGRPAPNVNIPGLTRKAEAK
jgi:hypothetical protein